MINDTCRLDHSASSCAILNPHPLYMSPRSFTSSPPALTHSSYSLLFPLTSQNPLLPSPLPPMPPSRPKNAYGSPSLKTSSPSLVYWPSPCLSWREIWPAHCAYCIGFSGANEMTMPIESSRMEVSSSSEMSSGRGVEAKVAVCSWVE